MEIIDKLIKEDSTFSEAKFRAKVDNIFIQLYTAVMRRDLTKIKHFLSDEVFEKYNNKIEELNKKNLIQMYDELNVSDTNIVGIDEFEDRYEIKVNLLTKYYDYFINKQTKKFVSGNMEYRKEKRVNLIFSKIKNAKILESARKCDGCGANMDLNQNGVCSYCGAIYKLNEYDWVLKEIED